MSLLTSGAQVVVSRQHSVAPVDLSGCWPPTRDEASAGSRMGFTLAQFTLAHKARAAAIAGVPIVLPRTVLARMLAELL